MDGRNGLFKESNGRAPADDAEVKAFIAKVAKPPRQPVAGVAAVSDLTDDPGNDTKLRLYALYKQATVGDVTGRRPAFLDLVGRAKYDAWAALAGVSSKSAEADYVTEVARLTGH